MATSLVRQTFAGLDRPNNVDVEYGLPFGGQRADIVVATERLKQQLRMFRIEPDEPRLRANEIEAVAVDDALGYVYYADEGDGIHKWHADPDHPEANRELAVFGRTGAALPHGAMIAMNSTPRTFLVFPWDDVAAALLPRR